MSFMYCHVDPNGVIIGTDSRMSEAEQGTEGYMLRTEYDDTCSKIIFIQSLDAVAAWTGQNTFDTCIINDILALFNGSTIEELKSFLDEKISRYICAKIDGMLCVRKNDAFECWTFHNEGRTLLFTLYSTQPPKGSLVFTAGDLWAVKFSENSPVYYSLTAPDQAFDLVKTVIDAAQCFGSDPVMTIGGTPNVWYCPNRGKWKQYEQAE